MCDNQILIIIVSIIFVYAAIRRCCVNPIEDVKCKNTTGLTYVEDINNTVNKKDDIPLQNTMIDNLN